MAKYQRRPQRSKLDRKRQRALAVLDSGHQSDWAACSACHEHRLVHRGRCLECTDMPRGYRPDSVQRFIHRHYPEGGDAA
jgi:hypothetical protein